MKRLLRSTIDLDGTVTQENLVQNFQKLLNSGVDWQRPDDQRIYNYLLDYFQQRLEIPSIQTVRDYFTKVGDSGDTEVEERLKDIEAAPFYIRTNYTHLLSSIREEQNVVKAVALLKETNDIITKGLDFTEPGSREKLRKKGVKDGLVHFTSKSHDLITTETSARTSGDVRLDGQAIWNEYLEAKHDKHKAWGKFTGINEIDVVCHGIKPGELWVHAAFAGELKCLVGDTTIYDHATGRKRSIGELYSTGDLPVVTALDRGGETFHLTHAQASHLVQNGIRTVYELRLDSGKRIKATLNHRFFTPSGWKELGDLHPSDWVAVPKQLLFDGQRLFTDAEVAVVGYLIGDGTLTEQILLTASNEAVRSDFKRHLLSMGFVEGVADYKTPTFTDVIQEGRAPSIRVSHSAGDGNSGMVSPVRLLLELLGLYGSNAYHKTIPEDFFGLPDNQVALLLGALWATDGSCHTGDHERADRTSACHRNDITYPSVSEALCLGVQSLLLRLGIQSTVTKVNTTYHEEPYTFYVTRVVTRASKRRFSETIRVTGKEEQFAEILLRLPAGDDAPIPSEFVPDGAKVPFVRGQYRYASQVRGRPSMTRDTALLFAEYPMMRRVLDGDLAWEKVDSVIVSGREMTYDLSVPGHHSFVANDIVTHNTTFALNWCYNLVTRYRTNVLYFSLEMTYEQLRRQIMVMHSSNGRFKSKGYKPLDYRKVRDGDLSPEDEAFLQVVIHDWESDPNICSFEIRVPDRDITIDDVRLETELAHKAMEVGLIVIDHGLLLEPRKGRRSKDYTIELNSIIKDTKKLALHFNHGSKIPVLMLFQINRQGREEAAKKEGRYTAAAIAYANEVEKSADYITTTYLDEETHRKNGTTFFTNLKNRENPLFEPFLARVDFACRRISTLDISKASGRGMSVEDYKDQTDAATLFGV